MANEFKVKNGLIVIGDLTTSGTITINGALAATQSWVTSQAYLTSASLSGYATQSYVTSAISALIDAAPAALDTLNELAAALGDDASFSTTVTNSIASKLPLAGGTLTGDLNLNYGYPRINFYDDNHNPDYSLINNDGGFSLYDITNNVHRLWVSSSGNVGIGTSNPSYKLDVRGNFLLKGDATDGGILTITRRYSTGAQTINFNNNHPGTNLDWTGARITSADAGNYNGYLDFAVSLGSNGSEATGTAAVASVMRLTKDGNVGIGTVSPSIIGTGIISLDIQGSSAGGLAFGPSGIKNYIYGASTMYVEAHTTAVFATSGSEKMRITSGGSLLIGSTTQAYNPQTQGYLFGVKSNTTQTFISIAKSDQTLGSGGMIMGLDSTTGYVWMRESTNLTFGTNNTARVTIAADGNVGIGTASPNRRLSVFDTGNNYQMRIGYSDFYYYELGRSSSDGYFAFYGNQTGYTGYRFGGVDGTHLTITPSGNVGIGTTSPSQKLDVIGTIRSQVTSPGAGNGDVYAFAVHEYNGNNGRMGLGLHDMGDAFLGLYSDTGVTTRIDSNGSSYFMGGNVGIGTTSPNEKLDVRGNIYLPQNNYIYFDNSGHYIRRGSSDVEIQGYNGIQLRTNSTTQVYINQSGNVGIGTISPSYKLDVSGTARFTQSISLNQSAVIKKRFDSGTNNPVKTASGVLTSRSDNGGGSTYYVIETNVPQDEYQMGGFTIELFGNYNSTNHKTKIDLGGYWNPEGNGGFIGFEAHGSNPQYKPTIEVARNTSTGNTAFIIYGLSWNYPVIVARDLWLGYNGTDGGAYGEGWSIVGTETISGYNNRDTVVWRNAYSDSNPAGYITGYTETDTLQSVTSRGATTNTLVSLNAGLRMGNAYLTPSGDQNHFHFDGTAIIPNSSTTANNASIGTNTYRWSSVYGGYGYFSENVGIGTTSPSSKLTVYSDTTADGILVDVLSRPRITLRDRGNSDTILGTGDYGLDDFFIDTYSGNAFAIKGSTRNVGIGTTNPIYKLQVVGSAYVNGGTLFLDSSQYLRWGNSNQGIVGVNDDHVAIVSGGATRQTIYADGRTYFPGLDLSISNVNSSHGTGTYFRGSSTHFVLGLNNGNTLYLNYGNDGGSLLSYGTWSHQNVQILSTTRVLTNVSGNISMFTNDAGYLTSYTETDTLQSVTSRGATTTNRLEFQYSVDRYSQAWRNTSTGAYWWVTTDSDKLGLHLNGDGDKFYFGNNGDFYSTANGWLSSALAAKQNAATAINTSNIGSQSVSYANSAGEAGQVTNQTGQLLRFDNRIISPSETTAGYLQFGFTSWTNDNNAPYADYLHLRSYTDASGGNDNLVMFLKSGIGMRIYQQSWGTTAPYSSYVDVWTSANFTSTNVSNWNTAYGWGNHASAGYLTSYSETDTLATVTSRGNSTTNRINVRGIGNQVGGNIMMGDVGQGTNKWSYLTGTHYNASSQPQGFALIGGLSTDSFNAVVIGGNIYETNPATEIQFWTHSATTHNLGGTQRGVITSAGNWGVGTTSPQSRLHVETSSSNVFRMVRGSTNFGFEIGAGAIGLYDYEDSVYRWYVDSIGNVGIGTTSPGWKLHVAGESYTSGVVRIGGTSPLYFEDYGGGWYMADSTWVRTWSGKSVWVGGGLLGGDGGLTIGYGGTGSPSGGAIIAGNVGIGTATPSYKLHVNGTAYINETLYVNQATTIEDTFTVKTQTGSYNIATIDYSGVAGGRIKVYTDGVVRSQIGSYFGDDTFFNVGYGGNVGVGTSTPSEKLHVSGAAIFDGGAGNSSTDAVVYITKSTNDDWGLYVNNAGLDYGMYTRTSPSANYAFAIHNGTTWTTRITGNAIIYLGEKDAIRGNSDSWLRLNNSNDYTSGVYTPGIMRADGGFNVSGNTVWHAANDGSGSGLDADLLDGQDSSVFLRLLPGGAEASLDSYTDNGVRSVSFAGHSQHLLSWNAGGSTGTVQQLFHYGTPNNGWRIRNKTDNNSWSDWGYVVMASSNQGLISGTIATQSWVGSQSYATTSYVTTQINNLINGAPGALDTLDELAAALGDDANFATTVTNSIAGKVSKAGDTMTGNINWNTQNTGLTWNMNTDGAYIKFFNTGDGDTNSRLEYSTSDNGDEYHRWVIAGVEKMNLKWGGLTVTDTIYASGGNSGNWNTAYGWGDHSSVGYALNSSLANYLPLSGGVIGGAVTINGNLTVNGTITENSSIKLKENVETSEGNLEKVVNLRPVTYNKIGSQTTELGLIAEEVAEVYPEFVQYDENGEPVGVHYSRLTAALIGAVKELTNQVQELNKKING